MSDEPENELENNNESTTEREEKQEVVFVVKDDRARKVEVKTGIQDNTSIEVLEGLNVGDEVVIAPYNVINKTLKDSTMVKVVKEEELYKSDD